MIADSLLANPVVSILNEKFPQAIVEASDDLGELTLTVAPSEIAAICGFLKGEAKFVRLSGITANDWWPADPRFEVVYHLHRLEPELRLRLKVKVAESNPEIESVTGVWRAANWYEREIFDLFGVRFTNHPDLTRILMPEDWEGHPLRKDYPVHGHKYSYQNE